MITKKKIEQNLPEFKNPLVGRKYRRSAWSCEEPLYKNDPDTRFVNMKMKPNTNYCGIAAGYKNNIYIKP